MRYVHDEPKIYEAIVKFGAETDTEDPSGKISREAPLPSRESLERAALEFIGTIDQVPPAFSAKQVDGERSYDLARAGRAVELAPVAVTIFECTLSAFDETTAGVTQCALRVSCAGGTYVRSIARDLARAVASAAHLTSLRRMSAGGFLASEAFSLESLQSAAVSVSAPLAALDGYPSQNITPEEIVSAGRGMSIEARVDGDHASLLDETARAPRRLVAFAERVRSETGDRWQPRVVMRDA
jgi:tRNA pseudouridine55 synthase